MILALPFGDIPRNFRDGKHFKAHASFGDISRTLICETISRHQQTQHQPKGSRKESGWDRRWPARPCGLFFYFFSKGKIQDLLFWSCALQECKHVGQRGSDSLGQSLTPLIWGSHRVFFSCLQFNLWLFLLVCGFLFNQQVSLTWRKENSDSSR